MENTATTKEFSFELEYHTNYENHSYVFSNRILNKLEALQKMENMIADKDNCLIWIKAHVYDVGNNYMYAIDINGNVLDNKY